MEGNAARGIHWDTLQKIEFHPEPPGYRMGQARPKPKLAPLDLIAQIIKDDKSVHKKQRHTAERIYHRIKEMGYEGSRIEPHRLFYLMALTFPHKSLSNVKVEGGFLENIQLSVEKEETR